VKRDKKIPALAKRKSQTGKGREVIRWEGEKKGGKIFGIVAYDTRSKGRKFKWTIHVEFKGGEGTSAEEVR